MFDWRYRVKPRALRTCGPPNRVLINVRGSRREWFNDREKLGQPNASALRGGDLLCSASSRELSLRGPKRKSFSTGRSKKSRGKTRVAMYTPTLTRRGITLARRWCLLRRTTECSCVGRLIEGLLQRSPIIISPLRPCDCDGFSVFSVVKIAVVLEGATGAGPIMLADARHRFAKNRFFESAWDKQASDVERAKWLDCHSIRDYG